MKRRGFTLVELLVVISIIGMLMALLLPAVNAAREVARQNTCKNRAYQLAKACQTFESSKGRYPGWKDHLKNDGGTNLEVSWVVMLLPNLERSDLYDAWRSMPAGASGGGVNGTAYMGELVCPNARRSEEPQDAPLSYAANCGIRAGDYAQAGVFVSQTGGVPSTSADYVSSNDGTSNTFMFLENFQAWKWWYHNETSGTYEMAANDYCPLKKAVGVVWDMGGGAACNTADVNTTKLNRCIDDDADTLESQTYFQDMVHSGAPDWRFARPASLHPGTFIAALCDGSVRQVADEVSLSTYRHVMCPDGRFFRAGNAVSAGGSAPDAFADGMFNTPWDGTGL